MVMLSELLRVNLGDDHHRRMHVLDLAVDLAAGDYPAVTHLIVQGPKQQAIKVPWASVRITDQRAGWLKVADLTRGDPVSAEAPTELVLLKRDILDAMVLDLHRRSALRSNDLWLQLEDGRLELRAADVSPWAVLRRLSRGLLGHDTGVELHDWKDIEFLRGDPAAARAGDDYHRRIARLPPGEIAHLCDALPYLHAAELLTLLPDALAADALEDMTPERQLQVFEELETDQGDRQLALLAPDVAADLVGRLPTEVARRALEHLPAAQRGRVVELLRYPEHTAGGIMTNDVVVAPVAMTVGEARQHLRDQLREPDFVYFVYVVDDEATRRLRGVLTLRDLLVADEERRLDEVMKPALVRLHALESADVVAQRVTDSQLAALPVVGQEGRLLGAVTIDAAVARVAPETWRAQAPRVFS